ncbi:MAG: calcium:proton antiporter [Verrucomicrobiota bacterium]
MRFLPRQSNGLLFGLFTGLAFLLFGNHWLDEIPGILAALFFFVWLVTAILCSAFSVVRQADSLAHRLGEPLGTLILTLSITGMEVSMISAVMLSGHDNPAFARDTMFAVVMIVLAGLVGTALLLGSLRHRQQVFNLQGAGAFLSLIIPLSLFGLVMPNFTVSTSGPTFSTTQAVVLSALCVGIYAIFLGIQTLRHREFFTQVSADDGPHPGGARKPLWITVALLLISLAPVVFLSEELAHVLEFWVHTAHLPPALAGVVVAGLILAPEGLTGIQAALKNELQRSVNLLLGSALATIALTIPAILIVGLLTNKPIVLGLQPREIVLLATTLTLSLLTFSHSRTNVLQGAVHLIVFLFWILLLVEG